MAKSPDSPPTFRISFGVYGRSGHRNGYGGTESMRHSQMVVNPSEVSPNGEVKVLVKDGVPQCEEGKKLLEKLKGSL